VFHLKAVPPVVGTRATKAMTYIQVSETKLVRTSVNKHLPDLNTYMTVLMITLTEIAWLELVF